MFNIKLSPVQTEEQVHGNKIALVFVQVVSFRYGKASVLQDLHFDFLRLLFGLLLQPLLLQNLFDRDLLKDCVAGFIHILQKQGYIRLRPVLISISMHM